MSGISDEEWQKMSPEERYEFQVSNCVFCKIIKGEIPSKKVFDDSDFFGVLDINPASKGHILLLPKKHVQVLPQLGAELMGKLGLVLKKLSLKVKKSLGVDGVSIFVANGAVAGQIAPHAMIHIIPRKLNDGVGLIPESVSVNLNNVNLLRKKFVSHLGIPDAVVENSNISNEGSVVQDAVKVESVETKKEDVDSSIVGAEVDTKSSSGVDRAVLDDISKLFD